MSERLTAKDLHPAPRWPWVSLPAGWTGYCGSNTPYDRITAALATEPTPAQIAQAKADHARQVEAETRDAAEDWSGYDRAAEDSGTYVKEPGTVGSWIRRSAKSATITMVEPSKAGEVMAVTDAPPEPRDGWTSLDLPGGGKVWRRPDGHLWYEPSAEEIAAEKVRAARDRDADDFDGFDLDDDDALVVRKGEPTVLVTRAAADRFLAAQQIETDIARAAQESIALDRIARAARGIEEADRDSARDRLMVDSWRAGHACGRDEAAARKDIITLGLMACVVVVGLAHLAILMVQP